MCGWDVGNGRREGVVGKRWWGEYWERRGGGELNERGGKSEWGKGREVRGERNEV